MIENTILSDENFRNLLANWNKFRDRILVFLGSGASIDAHNRNGERLPTAFQLRNEIWAEFKAPKGKPFDESKLGLMSLQHAAAIVESRTGRSPLSEYLVERFDCEKPLWPHVALPHLNPKAVFTTNYDELIELGFAANGKVIDTIYFDRAPRQGNYSIIFKPHGSLAQSNQPIGRGGLVITQFDYLEMIADYRKMLESTIATFNAKCVLIIGYSFGDMDIGAELYRVRKLDDGIPWYAVFPRGDIDVRNMYFKRLGIRQIDGTFEQFIAELDAQTDFIPAKLKHGMAEDMKRLGAIQQA